MNDEPHLIVGGGEETEAALLEAVRDVAELRRLLITALGLEDASSIEARTLFIGELDQHLGR
jgi:precorrin-6B methylase 2